MPRLDQDEMARVLFGVGGVGYVGTEPGFFSSGPHGESSLQAQQAAATTPGAIVDFAAGQAEAMQLARDTGGCLMVDPETGAIVGTVRPGEANPQQPDQVCQPGVNDVMNATTQGMAMAAAAKAAEQADRQASAMPQFQGGGSSHVPSGGVPIAVPGSTAKAPMTTGAKVALGLGAVLGGYRLLKGRWPW